MRTALFIAVAICLATPAVAADTVNSYTPAQLGRAKAAIAGAGYRADRLQMVQDGNFFFTASKGSQDYGATVASSGQVYVSNPTPAPANPAPS